MLLFKHIAEGPEGGVVQGSRREKNGPPMPPLGRGKPPYSAPPESPL